MKFPSSLKLDYLKLEFPALATFSDTVFNKINKFKLTHVLVLQRHHH